MIVNGLRVFIGEGASASIAKKAVALQILKEYGLDVERQDKQRNESSVSDEDKNVVYSADDGYDFTAHKEDYSNDKNFRHSCGENRIKDGLPAKALAPSRSHEERRLKEFSNPINFLQSK
jgi:hypothetical protein